MAKIVANKKEGEIIGKKAEKQKELAEQKRYNEEKIKQDKVREKEESERKRLEENARKREMQRLASLNEIISSVSQMERIRKESIRKTQEQRLEWIRNVEMPEIEKKAIRQKKIAEKEKRKLQEDVAQKAAEVKQAATKVKQKEPIIIKKHEDVNEKEKKDGSDISKKENRIALFKILQLEKKIFEVHGLYSLSKIRDAKALYHKVAEEYKTLNQEEKKRVHKSMLELDRLLRKE